MTMALLTPVFCSCCLEKFETRMCVSSNSFGPLSTDLYQRAAGEQPLHSEIHTCPHCGYTASSRDFATSTPRVDPRIRQFVKDQLTPLVHKEKSWSASRKYELRAMIEEHIGAPPHVLAHLYLRAAWCCNDDGLNEEEMRHRRLAIEWFKRALEEGTIEQEIVPQIIYLIGELYRRVGEAEQAGKWFDRTLELAIEPEWERLTALALQQMTAPREFIRE